MDQLDEILTYIAAADDAAAGEIIQAIIRRYGTAHPDWEIMFLSLPRHDPAERQRILSVLNGFPENHGI